jgi:hypothetical protein
MTVGCVYEVIFLRIIGLQFAKLPVFAWRLFIRQRGLFYNSEIGTRGVLSMSQQTELQILNNVRVALSKISIKQWIEFAAW